MSGRLTALWRRAIGRGGPPVPRPTLVLSFDYERGYAGEDAAQADRGLDAVCQLLAARGVRATFNCVARIGLDAPDRIAGLLAAGHEVACHGYAHESPRGLDLAAIDEMLRRSLDALGAAGARPVGFRSPQSHWNAVLLAALPRFGFRYSAEHDRAALPYRLSRSAAGLVRMPVATDDWDWVRRPTDAVGLTAKHLALVGDVARGGRRFVAIGYHPWLIGAEPARRETLERTLDAALDAGVAVVPFAALLA